MNLSKKLLIILAASAFSSVAFAGDCDITVGGNDAMQFDTKEIVLKKSCAEVTITLKHTGKLPKSAMGHNIVISEEANMNAIVEAGIKAGLAKEYLPSDKSKVLAYTKIIGGGESTSVKVKTASLAGKKKLMFYCTFPGHFALMKGTVVLK